MHNSLDQSLGFKLGVAYRKVSQLFQQQLKDHNLTPEQWAVLYRTGEQDGMIQREIGQRAGKDKPTTTRILVALEEKGMIRKVEGSTDRRSFRVYITEAGRDKVRQIEPIERATMSAVSQGISEEDYALFVNLLQRIIGNADKLIE
ncbi:MarR family winged helix-turn-helix transcriptional regulator [Paenibacillus caui]|uniref:MarR family winged helix-turn-helix transcriptional regulator n=1 Tax=Paenibacillus caui TaxID=2873927 RepID=UPI001F20F342|nr:MarR family transcriptional regulator [Paenibacillus caui]